jgi:hypothetical protein
VGVNKPFKGYVQAAWENFMVQNIENEKVMRDNVAQWVEAPWAQVTVSFDHKDLSQYWIQSWSTLVVVYLDNI